MSSLFFIRVMLLCGVVGFIDWLDPFSMIQLNLWHIRRKSFVTMFTE